MPIRNDKRIIPNKAFTHAGTFHADDVFSAALFNLSAKTAIFDGEYSAWPRSNRKATFYLNGVAIAMPLKCYRPANCSGFSYNNI